MTVGGAAGAVCGSGGAAAGAAMLCPLPVQLLRARCMGGPPAAARGTWWG